MASFGQSCPSSLLPSLAQAAQSQQAASRSTTQNVAVGPLTLERTTRSQTAVPSSIDAEDAPQGDHPRARPRQPAGDARHQRGTEERKPHADPEAEEDRQDLDRPAGQGETDRGPDERRRAGRRQQRRESARQESLDGGTTRTLDPISSAHAPNRPR